MLTRIKFEWTKFWALRAYKRREKKRWSERFPSVWRSHFQLVDADVRLLAEADRAQLSETLLDRLISGRDSAQKAIQARAAITAGTTGFLWLTILKVDLPLTVAGIQLKASPGVIELLIVVNAAIWCAAVSKMITAMTLTTAIKAMVQTVNEPESAYLHQAALHANEPPFLFLHPMSPHLTWRGLTKASAWATLAMLIGLIFSLLAVAGITRAVFYVHVWTTPSVETWIAQAAVALSLCLDVFAMIYLLIFVLPLPYRDYGLLTTLDIAEQVNSSTLRDLHEKYYGAGNRDREEMEQKGYLSSGGR